MGIIITLIVANKSVVLLTCVDVDDESHRWKWYGRNEDKKNRGEDRQKTI